MAPAPGARIVVHRYTADAHVVRGVRYQAGDQVRHQGRVVRHVVGHTLEPAAGD